MLVRLVFTHRSPSISLSFRFATSSRTQNFFQINPIHPDYTEKDFDLYNVGRRKIPVLDAYQKTYNRQQTIKTRIRQKLFATKYSHEYKKKSIIRKVDKETGFPITPIQELNNFIEKFKKDKSLGLNVQSEFQDVLYRLIRRFDAKSQTQLVRLLRITLANAKKGSIKDQLRAELIQLAVLRNAQTRKSSNPPSQLQRQQISEQHLDELAFQTALRQIDAKIKQAQLSLKYHLNGLPKTLSKFDVSYGEDPSQQEWQYNKDFSLVTERGLLMHATYSQAPTESEIQNWSIRRRVARLYFLERLRFVNEENNKLNSLGNNNEKSREDMSRILQLPVNFAETDKIINDLARKYKQAQLEQVPDLQEIYKEVDTVLNKIFMKMSTSKADIQTNKKIESRNVVEDKIFRKEDLLWNNIDAQQVFTPQCYLPENIEERQILQVSPNPHAELSLNRLPFNLYRHNDFQIFGVFNKYKQFILKNFLNNDTVDSSSQFRSFSLAQAKRMLGQVKSLKQPKAKYKARATRKSAIAKVTLTPGTGQVTVNRLPLAQYFAGPFQRGEALKPLIFTQTAGQYNVDFDVIGGGSTGQSQCCAYALARALVKSNPQFRKVLDGFGLVGSDNRKAQLKRIGLYSARVRPPFVRR